MSVGDVTALELVDWDWFCSCTVAARGASDIFLRRKGWALLRSIARDQRVHFQSLPFAFRCESGSDLLHRHFHFLVGSLKRKSQSDRFRTIAHWDRILGSTPDRVRGTCRVRLYESASGLADYLAKQLSQAEAQAWMSGLVIMSRSAARLAYRNAHRGGSHGAA